MIKKLFTGFIVLCFVSYSFAQADSTGLKLAMQKLDAALVQKDAVILRFMLHQDLSFGHSNGWIQSRKDVLDDFASGKLEYTKIENNSTAVIQIRKNRATATINTNVEGSVSGNPFKLNLHVMQIWLRTKKGWQLLARQSAKQ